VLVQIYRIPPSASITLPSPLPGGPSTTIRLIDHLRERAAKLSLRPTYVGGNLTVRLRTRADEMAWGLVVFTLASPIVSFRI
jgi:hypothetical protein